MQGTIILDRKKEKVEKERDSSVRMHKPEIQTSELEDAPASTQAPEYVMPQEELYIEKKEEMQKDENLNNEDSALTQAIQKYVKEFRVGVEKDKEKTKSPIYVDALASKLAKVYEKARRVIDWKEEHLVRRTAIERVLKRRLISKVSGIYFIAEVTPEQMAEPIVMELIRSGYFENGKISRNVIDKVKSLLEKYIIILQNNPISKGNLALNIKRKVEIYNWVIETAACEIEEVMDPPYKQQALLDFMCRVLEERIQLIPEGKISEDDKKIQILISVERTLFDLDDVFINYSVLKQRHPEIFGLEVKEDQVIEFSQQLLSIWEDLNKDLDYKHGAEFFKISEKHDAVYRVLGDVMQSMQNNPETIEKRLSERTTLGSMVGSAYESRINTLKKRLFRSAVYSTLSIFLAGGVSLYIVEVPLAKLVYGSFSPLAMFVDLAIPSAFMFILVALIRTPSSSNFSKLLGEIESVVYKSSSEDVYEIRLEKKKRVILNAVFFVMYLILGFSSLYGVFLIFEFAKVPWTSLYINTLNVAVVVFTAVVIKQRSKEITFEDGGSLWNFLIDMVSLPLAKIGAWISKKWKEYNFVSVFFTVLVDTPFATLISSIEDWRAFIKDKHSEIH